MRGEKESHISGMGKRVLIIDNNSFKILQPSETVPGGSQTDLGPIPPSIFFLEKVLKTPVDYLIYWILFFFQ